MAPHLKPEVIAAIECAVECNDGVLESGYIHSLAKIYKTSPQAVVWNMKRYNKVKAGCDDRQQTGRRAVIDKARAAEITRDIVKEVPGMRMVKISDRLFEEFGIRVSTTWVSRLIKNHKIAWKEPKPPKVKRVPRPLKPPPHPRAPVTAEGESIGHFTPQNQLPLPGPYPLFRQDLQQAMGAHAPPPSVPERNEDEHIPNALFGILRPTKALPKLQAPAQPPADGYHNHPSYPPQPPYGYHANSHPPHLRYPPPSPVDPPVRPINGLDNPPPTPKEPPATSKPETVWKVLNVVEMG